MFSKNNPVILMLDRNGFSLFQGTLVNILRVNFTPDIVTNLEVINKDQLFTLISSFIDKSRIYPSIIVVLLADTIVYEKDLSKITPKILPVPAKAVNPNSNQKTLDVTNKEQQLKTEVQNFLQNVPFEDILAKVIKIEGLVKLVAVNKDLIFSITDPFIKKGFLVEAIIPSFLCGQNVNFTNGLTLDSARLVLRKPELLKIANLLTGQEQISIPQDSSENENEKEKEKKHRVIRKYILIAVFLVLLIILGIFLVILGDKRKSFSANTVIYPSITPIFVEPSFPAGSSSAILNVEDVAITIVQNSRSEATFDLLKKGLTQIGFKNIISENSEEVVPAKSSILFSKDIPTEVRENAILEINKIFPGVLVLESESSDSKITILIGQS